MLSEDMKFKIEKCYFHNLKMETVIGWFPIDYCGSSLKITNLYSHLTIEYSFLAILRKLWIWNKQNKWTFESVVNFNQIYDFIVIEKYKTRKWL